MMDRRQMLLCTAPVLILSWSTATAQSLYEREPDVPEDQHQEPVAAGVAPALTDVSLFAVLPVEPRTYQQNDLVTIIVSERTIYDRSVEGESKKKNINKIDIRSMVELFDLLQLRVLPEDGVPVGVDIQQNARFQSEGTFEQEDRMADRITARVLDVKPNGTLLLEARRSLTTDGSDFVLTLSGICRSEDITDANTVQSNQMFDMMLDVQNSGELRRTTEKGVITRLLETIFFF